MGTSSPKKTVHHCGTMSIISTFEVVLLYFQIVINRIVSVLQSIISSKSVNILHAVKVVLRGHQ